MTESLALTVTIPARPTGEFADAQQGAPQTATKITTRTGTASAASTALPVDGVERDVAGARVAVLLVGRVTVRATGAEVRAEGLLGRYLEQGPQFARDLLGRFAIVVLDDRTSVAHLIRDHLGIVPVYYADIDGTIGVSSAVEPLITQPGFPRVFGRENLLDLFNSTSRVPGTTVLPALREVAPAHTATVSFGVVTQRAYWTPPTRADESLTAEDAVDAVREAVIAGVETATADLVGSTAYLLSGGIDSSVIDAIAARRSRDPLRTYSFRYGASTPGGHQDALHHTQDSPYAEEVSRHLGTVHREFVFESDVDHIALLSRAITARGVPGPGDLDNGLIRLLDHLVAEGADSYVGGEGADDIFGGFPWSSPDVGNIDGFPWLLGTSASELISPVLQREWSFDEALQGRWKQALSDHGADPSVPVAADSAVVSAIGITRFLPFLVDRADRLSRQAGVHAALPFLDPRVVEVGLSLPREVRRLGGIEKGALRSAFSADLPASVIARRKSGFAIDVDPAYTAAVRRYLRDRLQSGDSVLTDIVDVDRLTAILSSEQWGDGRFAAPPLLPRLVQLDLWASRFDLRFAEHEAAR